MTRSARGVEVLPAETRLLARARDLLAHGPATPAELVTRVCQLPAAPGPVADHMANALLGGHPEFVRDADGRWRRADRGAEGPATAAASAASGAREADRAPGRAPGRDDRLVDLSYAVVDVETTGGSPDAGHRVTEIAIVRVQGGEIVERFDTLVNPQRPVPRFITGLTGITDAMVRDRPPFREHCPRVTGMLAGHVFVAHNVGFDWRFVTSEVAIGSGERLEGRRLCTVRLARRLLPQLRRRSLGDVCHHYAIDNAARHRALGDAEATALVLIRLIGELAERGCTTWGELEALLASSSASTGRRRRRPPGMPGWAHGGEGA